MSEPAKVIDYEVLEKKILAHWGFTKLDDNHLISRRGSVSFTVWGRRDRKTYSFYGFEQPPKRSDYEHESAFKSHRDAYQAARKHFGR